MARKKEITLREFSRLRGVSHTATNKARREGRITARRGPRGEYLVDPEVAEKQWQENTRPAAAAAARPDSAQGSQAHSNAIIKSIDAKMRLLDLEERQKNLFKANEAAPLWDRLGRDTRDAVEAVPDRVCDLLAAMTDPKAIKRMLLDELRAALRHVVNEFPRG